MRNAVDESSLVDEKIFCWLALNFSVVNQNSRKYQSVADWINIQNLCNFVTCEQEGQFIIFVGIF